MDELGGLIGALVGVILLIYVVVWLIAIAVAIAIGVTLIAGPPLGLGTILKRLLTQRYTLSRRKKWQCAGLTLLACAAPLLALFVDTSPMSCLAVAWASVVLGMSSMASYLAISAYQQHFALHRRAIQEARSTWRSERLRQKLASLKLWRMNRTLARIERRHGSLLRAHDDLTARVDALVESTDPALCRIKLSHWEDQYAGMPIRRVADELAAVSSELVSAPESQHAAIQLHSLFLETHVLRRRMAKHQSAARYNELKAERDELQTQVAGCAKTMSACQQVQTERKAKIAELRTQRLLIQ